MIVITVAGATVQLDTVEQAVAFLRQWKADPTPAVNESLREAMHKHQLSMATPAPGSIVGIIRRCHLCHQELGLDRHDCHKGFG